MKSVGIVGLGKLGLPLTVLFAKYFQVKGVDICEERIKQIKRNHRFFEPQVNEYLEKYGRNLTVSTDFNILVDCEVVFIITQTPSLPSGKFDLQYVESALKKLHQVNPKCFAVVSSTINVGDIDKLQQVHKRIVYNPEFIKQGTIIQDFANPKYILIGAYRPEDGELVQSIWKKINYTTPTSIVKPMEAEIIKLSANFSFALGISFANMMGELCEKFKADPNKVLGAIYRDRRDYKPGLGFSGPCFPRDLVCFMQTCAENNVVSGMNLASAIDAINESIVTNYLRKIKSYGKRKIGFLGASYKPNVPYVYESQPLKIAEQLSKEGYEIFIYDPLAEDNAKKVLLGNTHFCSTIEECVESSEVVFVGTKNFSYIKLSKPTVNPWK